MTQTAFLTQAPFIFGRFIREQKRLLILSVMFLFSGAIFAQESKTGSVFGAEMVEIMQHMKTYTLAIADLMPEEKYDFRPTLSDTVRTFAEQLKHLIFATNNQSENLLKAKAFDPRQLVRDMELFEETPLSKAEIIQQLSGAFDKLIARLAEMTDADFDTQYTLPFINATKSLRVMAMFIRDHISHHRAQIIVYLRMNGIEPMFYKPF